ncbi:MAG: hemolysin III [Saprospiraceae bacterium]|jgi:hemolysin III
MEMEQKQELANALTHGIGILLTIIGSIVLIFIGVQKWQGYHIFGLALFCFSLLMVYTSSTIYHCVKGNWQKYVLKKIDHISIYLLIGGTHTPFVLLYLDNDFGRNYLITLWGLILIGILYKIFLIGRWKWFSLAFYIFLGWMAVFIIPSMKDQMSSSVFYWILAGGVSYTTGTIFFAWEKLPYHHAIWHLFVLGGSAGHYVAMVYAYG